jgi:hypothetical protein
MRWLDTVVRLEQVLLLLLVVSPAGAAEPWRAVARVASEEERLLLERVRGQSSDLPVLLVEDPGPPLALKEPLRWRGAEALAEVHQARAVLWFQRTGVLLHVHLAEPGTRHLFVRAAQVRGRPGSLEWSTGAEAVALVVRSALRAVEVGEPLGEEVAVAPAPPEPVESLLPAESLVPEPPVSVPTPAPVSAPRSPWQLAVGAQAALDGYGMGGLQGGVLGAGWEQGGWRVRLQLFVGLPAEREDGRTRVALRQQGGGVWADATLASTERWRWALGGGVGAVRFSRHTEAQVPEVEATPSRQVFALATGPESSLRWRLSRRVALEAAVAAEALWGRPVLGYLEAGEFVTHSDGWSVRPRLSVTGVLFP